MALAKTPATNRQKLWLFTVVLSGLSALALVQACGTKTSTVKACTKDKDCDVGFVCKEEACVQAVTCETLKCQDKGETCVTTRTEARCTKPGCRANADCSAGQFCVDSVCGAAPSEAVDSCEIVNATHVFAPNAVVKIDVVAYDASGRTIPYKTATGLNVTGSAFTANASAMTLTATSTAGTAEVTAQVGSKNCEVVTFSNIGALPTDTYRITLLDQGTGQPITGLNSTRLRVSFSDIAGTISAAATMTEASAVTGTGTYTTPLPNAAADEVMHVAVLNADGTAPAYATTSIVGVDDASTRDFTLSLNKFDSATGFSGQPNLTEYDAKIAAAGFPAAADMAVVGTLGSLPLSTVLSLDLNLIAGDLANKQLSEVVCNIPNISSLASVLKVTCPATPPVCAVVSESAASANAVPLPRWLWGKGGNNNIGPNCANFTSRVTPGFRLNWSLGVKLNTTTVINAALPLVDTASGSITTDFTKIATAISKSGIFDVMAISADNFAKGKSKFTAGPESAWKTFVGGGAGAFETSNPKSYRLFRAKPTNFASTGVPDDPIGGIGGTLNATALIVASVAPGFGLVPLGLGIGVDNDGNREFDLLSADDPEMKANTIYSRYANPPYAISDADVISLAITTNFKDLTATSSTAGKKSATVVRGLVSRNSDPAKRLGWNATDANPNIGSFTDATKNAKFVGFVASNGSFGTADGSTKVTYSKPSATVLNAPRMKWDMSGAEPDLVVMRISADKYYWNVIIDPSRASSLQNFSLQSSFDIGTVLPEAGVSTKKLGFVTVAMKFKGGAPTKKVNAFASNTGKDFDQMMGDVESFAIFVESAGLPGR